MIKAVIIDFDDTLVQTSRFRRNLLETSLRTWTGLSHEKIVLNWGQPFCHMIKTFVGTDNLELFIQYYKSIMEKNPIEPCKGAKRFLKRLRQHQIPVIILSSGLREFINFDLHALGFLEMIAYVFDSEIVEKPKPNPCALQSPIDWLQKKYNISPSQCVYAGDSLTDMECSYGQIDFYAVLSGSTLRQDFVRYGLPENMIVENLDDLLSIIVRLAQ
jgi:phosphoglycolate phosphatase-like HAD superfamily hydrolase